MSVLGLELGLIKPNPNILLWIVVLYYIGESLFYPQVLLYHSLGFCLCLGNEQHEFRRKNPFR